MATTSKKDSTYKVKNAQNYEQFPKEIRDASSKLPHKAIPDDTMSVEELVRRSMRGQPIPGQIRPGFYDEEDEQPDFAKMDISEQEEYITERHNEAVLLREKIKKEQSKKGKDLEKLNDEIDNLKKQLKDLEGKQGPEPQK